MKAIIFHSIIIRRGSTFGNKAAWAAAAGAVSPEAATAVEKEKNWRHKYTK